MFIKSKLSAVTSKLVDNDPNTGTAVISNIEENIEKIQYMQTDLQLQIAEAKMYLAEINSGLVIKRQDIQH